MTDKSDAAKPALSIKIRKLMFVSFYHYTFFIRHFSVTNSIAFNSLHALLYNLHVCVNSHSTCLAYECFECLALSHFDASSLRQFSKVTSKKR